MFLPQGLPGFSFGVAVPTTWEEVKAAIDKVRALPEHKNIGGVRRLSAKYEADLLRLGVHFTTGREVVPQRRRPGHR